MNELNLNLSVKREKFELSVTEKLNLENGIFAINIRKPVETLPKVQKIDVK